MHEFLKFLCFYSIIAFKTLKIKIVTRTFQKIFMKTFFKSATNFLSEDIFFIFFGSVVPKIFTVIVCTHY